MWVPEWARPVTMQDAAVAVGDGVEVQNNNYGAVALAISIATTATITFEGYNEATGAWVAIPAVNRASAASATTATASGLYYLVAPGIGRIRARISAWTAGAVTVIGRAVPYMAA